MALSKPARWRILQRDEFACRYCGRRAPDVVLEVDHVTPRCQGGSDEQDNLVAACEDCNRSKSGSELSPGDTPGKRSLRRAYTMCWISSAFRHEAGNMRTPELEALMEIHPHTLYELVWRTQIWLDCIRAYPHESGLQHVLRLAEMEQEPGESAA